MMRTVWWTLAAVVGIQFLAVAALSGCTTVKETFTNPTGTITIPRQDFIDAYARARELYVVIHAQAVEGCRQRIISEVRCQGIAEVHEQAKQFDFEVRAKIAIPETTLDWQMITKVISFAVKLVI